MCTSRRNSRPPGRWVGALALTATAVCLAACAVGPNFARPDPPKVDHYAEGEDPTSTPAAEGQAQRLEHGAQVVGDWWTLFGSDQLDTLMKKCAADNQTVRAALASLRSSVRVTQAAGLSDSG